MARPGRRSPPGWSGRPAPSPVRTVGWTYAPPSRASPKRRYAAAGEHLRALARGPGRSSRAPCRGAARRSAACSPSPRRGASRSQLAGRFRQPRRELVEDRPLHVEAFGAEADLSAVGEARPHGARRPRRRGRRRRRSARRSCRRARSDTAFTRSAAAFMIAVPVADSPVNVIASTPGCRVRNSPAESGPKPCTRLKTPSGTPAAAITSASSGRRGRRLLGRLDHHRVAAGKRGRDLPGEQQQRQVPRHDDRHHADRFAHGVVQRPPAGRGHRRERLGRRGRHDVGEGAEVGRPARDVQRPGLRDRLAGVGDLGRDQIVEPALQLVGDPPQHAARSCSHIRPHGHAAPPGQRRPRRRRSARSASATVEDLLARSPG